MGASDLWSRGAHQVAAGLLAAGVAERYSR
jgi:hypothetical protein